MSHVADVRAEAAPPLLGAARGLVRWISTSNPFYVISAGLFLIGLRISFGPRVSEVDTWALMAGLAGYTLLLAVTAFLLVRYAQVWEDARTVLLLVVLMFLATSVTFDELLVLDPGQGIRLYLGGLLFAVAVSEGLLHGIRLRLPAGFRVPYYLLLALFFLYPVALSPWVDRPESEALLWGLLGFSSVAGLIFLTLLPALRRGPGYVRANGSPWPWPLYPWTLFGMLAAVVPARAFLLCWSMHLLGGDQLIFGPYFLVPFGFALAVLLLEAGLVSRCRGLLHVALAVPAALVVLAMVGHRQETMYRLFLEAFAARLGGDPLFLTVVAAAAYYGYAALRGVPLATEALTAALAALSTVGPDALRMGLLAPPRPEPILAAAALQLGLSLRRDGSGHCLAGGILVALATLAIPEGTALAPYRVPLAAHLVLVAVLGVGAAFDDALARWLRVLGVCLGLAGCVVTTLGPAALPAPAAGTYLLGMATVLAGYALVLGHRLALASALVVLTVWLAAVCWQGYTTARQQVVGLDYLFLSLAVFAVAVLISLSKANLRTRWTMAREQEATG